MIVMLQGLVLLDLRHAPLRELRRVPSTSWYRLQRAVEPADLALVVATPTACVPSAQLRFELEQAATLGDNRTFYRGGSRLFQFDANGKYVFPGGIDVPESAVRMRHSDDHGVAKLG